MDNDNKALKERATDIKTLRETGRPTLPTTMGSERDCNPFVRAPDVETLAKLRTAKDSF